MEVEMDEVEVEEVDGREGLRSTSPICGMTCKSGRFREHPFHLRIFIWKKCRKGLEFMSRICITTCKLCRFGECPIDLHGFIW